MSQKKDASADQHDRQPTSVPKEDIQKILIVVLIAIVMSVITWESDYAPLHQQTPDITPILSHTTNSRTNEDTIPPDAPKEPLTHYTGPRPDYMPDDENQEIYNMSYEDILRQTPKRTQRRDANKSIIANPTESWRTPKGNVELSGQSYSSDEEVSPEELEGRIEMKLLKLTNMLRVRSGARRLQKNPKLEDIAREHTKHMEGSKRVEHSDPKGRDIVARVAEFGYLSPRNISEGVEVGPLENIGKECIIDSKTIESEEVAKQILRTWFADPVARSNMFDPDMQMVGIAVKSTDQKCFYVTQDLR